MLIANHPVYHRYIVRSDAVIYTVKRSAILGEYLRPCKPQIRPDGYLSYRIEVSPGVYRHRYAHRLVAECFMSNPDGLADVNHKDLNKQNNDISNLEWISHKDNIKHATEAKGGHWNGKLSADDKEAIISRYKAGETQIDIADSLNVSQSTIHALVKAAGLSEQRQVITDEQVKQVREYYADGRKLSWIARYMGLNYQSTVAIAKRLRRK